MKTLSTLISLHALLLASLPSLAGDLLFHAPYENTLDATMARGERSPAGVQGDFAFAKGTFGAAVKTGATNSFLLYSADQNVRGEEGTVSLWVQPEWKPDDNKFHMLWTFLGNGVLNLYKFGGGDNKLIFLITGRDVPRNYFTTASTTIEKWKPGQPHHVAATWTAGTIRLYVDGKLADERTDPALAMPEVKAGQAFLVGDYYHPNWGTQSGLSGQADTLIRDLRIYGKALPADQIAELAGVKKKP